MTLNLSLSEKNACRPNPWQGISVGRHRIEPNEFQDHVSPLYSVDVHLSRPYHLEWKKGARYCRTRMVSGAICVAPADAPISLRWSDTLEFLKVTLTPAVLSETADSLKRRGDIEIGEHHGDMDLPVSHLCQALWSEAKAGYPLGRVFGESLGAALAACLLQRYSTTSPPTAATEPGKLSMRAWRQLQHFIDEHLESDISLDDMATTARLSPYYFARCFKETAGTSPHQYLISRRVERARQLIVDSSLSLAEVAVQSGFADQSHLTRHMKRLLGVTPRALAPQRNRRTMGW